MFSLAVKFVKVKTCRDRDMTPYHKFQPSPDPAPPLSASKRINYIIYYRVSCTESLENDYVQLD